MNNKLETVIAEINLGRKIDIRGFFVVGSFTESDIDIIKQKIIDKCIYDIGEDALDDFANGEPFDDKWLYAIGATWRKKQD